MPASMYPTALYTHGRLASDQELTLDEWNQIGKEVEAIESTLNWVFGNPALFPGVSQAPVPWKLSVQELSWGVGTIRGRLVDYGGAGNMQVRANASVVDLLDDATKAGWAIRIGATLTVDTFSVFRAPATGGTATWRELLQVDSAGSITAPGTTAGGSDQAVMRLGTRTQKLRVYALPGLDWGGLTLNNAYDGATWTRDDAAKPAWRTVMRTDLDQFTVEHVTAAGGSTLPVTVDASGIVTVASGVTISSTATSEKWRLRDVGTGDFQLRYNQNSVTNTADNPAKTSWAIRCGAADDFALFRAPAGSPTSFAQLLTVAGSNANLNARCVAGSIINTVATTIANGTSATVSMTGVWIDSGAGMTVNAAFSQLLSPPFDAWMFWSFRCATNTYGGLGIVFSIQEWTGSAWNTVASYSSADVNTLGWVTNVLYPTSANKQYQVSVFNGTGGSLILTFCSFSGVCLGRCF